MGGVAACVASAGVPARCGGPWARLGAWAPSLVCGGFARKSFFFLTSAPPAQSSCSWTLFLCRYTLSAAEPHSGTLHAHVHVHVRILFGG